MFSEWRILALWLARLWRAGQRKGQNPAVSGAIDGEANVTKRICRLPTHWVSYDILKLKTQLFNTNLMKSLKPDPDIVLFWTVVTELIIPIPCRVIVKRVPREASILYGRMYFNWRNSWRAMISI